MENEPTGVQSLSGWKAIEREVNCLAQENIMKRGWLGWELPAKIVTVQKSREKKKDKNMENMGIDYSFIWKTGQ